MGFEPWEGADHLILNANYMQWFMAMSPEGKEFTEEQNQQMQEQAAMGGGEMGGEEGGGGPGVQYVDEQGNPIDPSQIDPETMEFEDEDGNPVDHEGNPSENADEAEERLPFEEEEGAPEEDLLPFEEKKEQPKSKQKLPFEE